jgi:signal transduction histidine kinase
VKHSSAREAIISAKKGIAEVRLVISDNGKGFDASGGGMSTGMGSGLGNIAERVHTMGGSVVFDSRPGKGTSVDIRVPRP